MAKLPRPSLESALCQLDNHDHSRFLTRTTHVVGRLGELGYKAAEQGTSKGLFRAAVLVQMSWPGAPGIYYGDEAGVCGFTDPDNRRPYPWGREDQGMIDFYENLIRLRRRHPALRKGSLRIIKGEQGLLVFARLTAEECLLTVVHQGIQEKEITLDLKEIDGIGAAKLHRLIRSDENGYNLGWEEIAAENGNADLTLAPRESDLYLLSR